MKVSFGVPLGSQSKSKTKFVSDAVNGLSLLRHGSEKGPTANVPLGGNVEIVADAGAMIGGQGLLRLLGRDFPRNGGGPQNGVRDLQLVGLILSGENLADYARDIHTQRPPQSGG